MEALEKLSHKVAEALEHELLHQVRHLESVVVHLNPAVDGAESADSHELTGHHKSKAAREAYRTLQASQTGE